MGKCLLCNDCSYTFLIFVAAAKRKNLYVKIYLLCHALMYLTQFCRLILPLAHFPPKTLGSCVQASRLVREGVGAPGSTNLSSAVAPPASDYARSFYSRYESMGGHSLGSMRGEAMPQHT